MKIITTAILLIMFIMPLTFAGCGFVEIVIENKMDRVSDSTVKIDKEEVVKTSTKKVD